jgi:hypothetical protein
LNRKADAHCPKKVSKNPSRVVVVWLEHPLPY